MASAKQPSAMSATTINAAGLSRTGHEGLPMFDIDDYAACLLDRCRSLTPKPCSALPKQRGMGQHLSCRSAAC